MYIDSISIELGKTLFKSMNQAVLRLGRPTQASHVRTQNNPFQPCGVRIPEVRLPFAACALLLSVLFLKQGISPKNHSPQPHWPAPLEMPGCLSSYIQILRHLQM